MFFSTSPIRLLRKIRAVTFTLSAIGVLLSAYSLYVHKRRQDDKDYKALCDISEEVSCSNVFTSKWGKGFGFLGSLLGEDSPVVLSNGYYGIAFYVLVVGLGEIQSVAAANIQKYVVLLTNLMSVYLAYILLFVLQNKCAVCFSSYAINFLLAVMCFFRVHYITSLRSKKKGGNKSASNQNAKNTNTKKNQNANNKNNNNNNNQKENKGNQHQQNVNKNIQNLKKKDKKQIAEPAVNHQNAVSSKKKPEQQQQNKNAQNNIKNRQNQNNPSKKNQNQNTSNKQSSNKSNANQNKHSKKKN